MSVVPPPCSVGIVRILSLIPRRTGTVRRAATACGLLCTIWKFHHHTLTNGRNDQHYNQWRNRFRLCAMAQGGPDEGEVQDFSEKTRMARDAGLLSALLLDSSADQGKPSLWYIPRHF